MGREQAGHQGDRGRGAVLQPGGLRDAGDAARALVAVAAFTVQRVSASGKKTDEAESKLVKDKPTAATSEPRRLEMPPPALMVQPEVVWQALMKSLMMGWPPMTWVAATCAPFSRPETGTALRPATHAGRWFSPMCMR